MIICDLCESKNPDLTNCHIHISTGNRGVEAFDKNLDLCMNCYKTITNKIENLLIPLPKLVNTPKG